MELFTLERQLPVALQKIRITFRCRRLITRDSKTFAPLLRRILTLSKVNSPTGIPETVFLKESFYILLTMNGL